MSGKNGGGRQSGALETGKVKWFDAKKGYGWITPDAGGGDVFVHHTGIDTKGFGALKDGERVQFQVTDGRKGPKAINVTTI